MNKQNGKKGHNDDFMPHTSTKTTTFCYVSHKHANHTDDLLICIAYLDSSKRLQFGYADRHFQSDKKVILDEIFIDTDFHVRLLFFRVRILSEKKKTVLKFSDEVVLFTWFKPNAFAYSLW